MEVGILQMLKVLRIYLKNYQIMDITMNLKISGVTVDKLRYNINNRIVDYDHLADKSTSAKDKLNRNYKLKIADNSLLPEYLIKNREKYS